MTMWFPIERSATAVKIDSFGDLPLGWHYGSGAPIGEDVRAKAIEVLKLFLQLGLTKTDSFPSEGGEILVTAYKQSRDGMHYIGVIVEPDGSFSFCYEYNGEEVDAVDSRDFKEIKLSIIKTAVQIWNTFGWRIPVNMTGRLGDSQTSLSNIPQMAACQSSRWNVRNPQAPTQASGKSSMRKWDSQ